MSNQWFCQRDGKRYGPATLEKIQEWVRAGRVTAEDLVTDNPAEPVRPARTFPQLFPQSTDSAAFAATAGTAATAPQVAVPVAAPVTATPTAASQHVAYQSLGGGGIAVGAAGVASLRKARFWMLLMAIVGFVVAGIMALGGLCVGGSAFVSRVYLMLIAVPIYIVGGALYFFAAWLLMKYTKHLNAATSSGDSVELDRAFAAQHSFWRYVGILMIISLVVGLLGTALPFFLASAASSTISHPTRVIRTR